MKDPKIVDIGDAPRNAEDLRSAFTRGMVEPLSSKGWPRWLVLGLAFLGLVYVLNPTFGIFELIPDNLPIVGNLDEGLAYILMLLGLVELFEGGKKNTLD
jgi:RsiW-degrading membrane proteinase PrsW (M82 family)